ncbi:MAG TPA: GNAT family N-acetyltransferase [Acidimicrobiales bacterium]|nr:GNAT family N-acetyltransferase [Acidimicrobiales bacterium]
MIDVRPATESDLLRLIARDPANEQFERNRYEAQQRGEALLLVAWDGDELRGRVRFRFFSKYVEVLDALGEFAEINALDAWPTGTGVGTRIIEECEKLAQARGDKMIGIGVLVTNTAARRLYDRLGYEYWGDVIDDGEPAAYLVKGLLPKD